MSFVSPANGKTFFIRNAKSGTALDLKCQYTSSMTLPVN